MGGRHQAQGHTAATICVCEAEPQGRQGETQGQVDGLSEPSHQGSQAGSAEGPEGAEPGPKSTAARRGSAAKAQAGQAPLKAQCTLNPQHELWIVVMVVEERCSCLLFCTCSVCCKSCF